MTEKIVESLSFCDAAISVFRKKKALRAGEKGAGKCNEDSGPSSTANAKDAALMSVMPTKEEMALKLAETYEHECLMIQQKYQEHIDSSRKSEIPYFYLRIISPISDTLSGLLTEATKYAEIRIREKEGDVLSAILFGAYAFKNMIWAQSVSLDAYISMAQKVYEVMETLPELGLTAWGLYLKAFSGLGKGGNVSARDPYASNVEMDHMSPSEIHETVGCSSEENISNDAFSHEIDAKVHINRTFSNDMFVEHSIKEVAKESGNFRPPSRDGKGEKGVEADGNSDSCFAPSIKSLTPLDALEGQDDADAEGSDSSHNNQEKRRMSKKKVFESSTGFSSDSTSLIPRGEEKTEEVRADDAVNTTCNPCRISPYSILMKNSRTTKKQDSGFFASLIALFSPFEFDNNEFLCPPLVIERPLNPMYVEGVIPFPRLSALDYFLSYRGKLVDGSIYYVDLKRHLNLCAGLWRAEGRLMAWDVDNDGRLQENEVENYVREVVEHRNFSPDFYASMMRFYCCTVARKMFWDLDSTNRKMISIEALLQSSVLRVWEEMGFSQEEEIGNWMIPTVTLHLHEKFLSLDSRNRGTLMIDDLKRYKKGLPTMVNDGLMPNVSPLSSLYVDRYFETNALRQNGEMDFREFVDFVIALEILPQCPRPLYFWNIFDLEHKGVLTPMTVNSFFRETHGKVKEVVPTIPPREILIPEFFDMISTAQPLCITRKEFVEAPQAGLFSSIIIDCLSFWAYENRSAK